MKASPVEWFVADEPETHTRYFVIQGSDNFDHWKVRLGREAMHKPCSPAFRQLQNIL